MGALSTVRSWHSTMSVMFASGSGITFVGGSCSVSGISVGGKIKINGKEYKGNAISIKNGRVIVDGKEQEEETDEKGTKVVYRNVTITVAGDVKSVETSSGDVHVAGNVGSARSTSGDIVVTGVVSGSVSSVSGDVKAQRIEGSASTVSGDIHGATN